VREKGQVVDKLWFKHGGPPSDGMRDGAVAVMTAALAAAAVARKLPDDFGAALVKAMFVQSPTLQVVRDVVLGRDLLDDDILGGGRPVPEPPIGPLGGGIDPRIPDWLDFEDVRRIGCVMDLQAGLGGVAGALNGVARPRAKGGATIGDIQRRSASHCWDQASGPSGRVTPSTSMTSRRLSCRASGATRRSWSRCRRA
jgi:hypothetical protein